MKRFIGSVLFLAVFGMAVAQAPFTIVRPADGSKIREKVKIMFPKSSIPDGGYVGIFINGQFVEATVPPTGAKYIEYPLDTKKMALPDGPTTIEAVLYVDFNEKPRVVDRSSVQVTVANQANIAIPEAGLALRYKFIPGTEMVYRMYNQIKFASISQAQADRGGRAAEQSMDTMSVRLLYAVDNKYSDGDGLLRLQPIPNRGTDYIEVPTTQNPQGRRYYQNEMHSIYMRVGNTGMEEFSSIPAYVPMEGSAGGSRVDLYAFFPLPTLPTKRVKPGDTWQTRFQVGDVTLGNQYNVQTLTEKVPARGEFLNVEWEAGHPCAKIRHSLAMNTGPGANQKNRDRVSMQETIWFALDLGQVVKIERQQVVNVSTSSQPASGPSGGRGSGGGGKGGAGTIPGLDGESIKPNPDLLQRGGKGSGGMAGLDGAGPSGGSGQGRQGTGAPSGAGGAGGGGTINRVTIQQTFILEQ